MSERTNTNIDAHLLAIAACIAWGGSYAVGRYGLNTGSAAWLTLWRWGPAGLVLSVYLLKHRILILEVLKKNWFQLLTISLLGVVIYPASLFLAVSNTTALNASLYLAASPVLIAIASTIVWKEPISRYSLIAIALGVIGVLVLLFRGDPLLLYEFQIARSDIWAIISALTWTAYCVSLPMKPKQLNEMQFLSTLIVIGCVLLCVYITFDVAHDIPFPSEPSTALSMIYFAIFPSFLAFLAWNRATVGLGPSKIGPYNNLVPLIGGAFGIMFLGESIAQYHIIGGSIIVASLMFNSINRS